MDLTLRKATYLSTFDQGWIISKALDIYYKLKLPLRKHGILPSYSVYDAVSTCCFSIAPSNFFEMVESKLIILKEVKSFHFCKFGIVINDEKEYVDADIVIFATGFETQKPIPFKIFPRHYFEYIKQHDRPALQVYRLRLLSCGC